MCMASHAEVNIINNAARFGVSTEGASMYLSCGVPCKSCLGEIINAGISEVVVINFDLHDEISETILKHSSLRIRRYEL